MDDNFDVNAEIAAALAEESNDKSNDQDTEGGDANVEIENNTTVSKTDKVDNTIDNAPETKQEPVIDYKSLYEQAQKDAELNLQNAQKKETETAALVKALGAMGISGDIADITNAINAINQGIPIEDYVAQKQEQERAAQAALENNAEYKRLLEENKKLKAESNEREYSSALKEINERYGTKFTKIQEIGENYIRARALGMDNIAAYEFSEKLKHPTQAPKEIGPVNSSQGIKRTYYTEAELDKLDNNDLDKPGVLERAMKSLLHIGK